MKKKIKPTGLLIMMGIHLGNVFHAQSQQKNKTVKNDYYVAAYIVYGTNSIKIRAQWDTILNVPVFPCVSIGWDDTPRFPAKGKKDIVHYHNTPQSFATLLSKAKHYADNHPEQPKLITINAWNEWVEGSYLLPDMLYGFTYLEAVKEVFIDSKYDRY